MMRLIAWVNKNIDFVAISNVDWLVFRMYFISSFSFCIWSMRSDVCLLACSVYCAMSVCVCVCLCSVLMIFFVCFWSDARLKERITRSKQSYVLSSFTTTMNLWINDKFPSKLFMVSFRISILASSNGMTQYYGPNPSSSIVILSLISVLRYWYTIEMPDDV